MNDYYPFYNYPSSSPPTLSTTIRKLFVILFVNVKDWLYILGKKNKLL